MSSVARRMRSRGARQRIAQLARKLGFEKGRGIDWVRQAEADPSRAPETPPPIYAMIITWHEGDIIESTINNLLHQGIQAVYLLDNDSSDDTVEAATAAGAVVLERFQTDFHDPYFNATLMRRHAQRIFDESGHDSMWWLFCDADEFFHGPSGRTVAEHVALLDDRFDVVGIDTYEHLPSGVPAAVRGEHPVVYQPLAYPKSEDKCRMQHWKHPLVRYRRGVEPPALVAGFHKLTSNGHTEPTEALVMHHIRYRNEEDTRRRLEALQQRYQVADSHPRAFRRVSMAERLATIDAIYDTTRLSNPDLRPWDEVARPEHRDFTVWHELPDRGRSSITAVTRRPDSPRAGA